MADRLPAPRTADELEAILHATLTVIADMIDQPRAAGLARQELDRVRPFLDARRHRAARRVDRLLARSRRD